MSSFNQVIISMVLRMGVLYSYVHGNEEGGHIEIISSSFRQTISGDVRRSDDVVLGTDNALWSCKEQQSRGYSLN